MCVHTRNARPTCRDGRAGAHNAVAKIDFVSVCNLSVSAAEAAHSLAGVARAGVRTALGVAGHIRGSARGRGAGRAAMRCRRSGYGGEDDLRSPGYYGDKVSFSC